MKDNSLLKMDHEDTHLGKVEIAPEVIEVIAGIAASEVDGVAEMRGNFATGVVERFGKVNHGKGVKVDLSDDGIIDRCILCRDDIWRFDSESCSIRSG
jgi:uncharacterized alkaline shock family protein YloU